MMNNFGEIFEILGLQCRNLLDVVYKQYCTKERVNESYQKLKNALKKLHDDYLHRKGGNIFSKYNQIQQIISEVFCRLPRLFSSFFINYAYSFCSAILPKITKLILICTEFGIF